MIAPICANYKGLPTSIFSYLWITSFTFSIIDWSEVLCREALLGTYIQVFTQENYRVIQLHYLVSYDAYNSPFYMEM